MSSRDSSPDVSDYQASSEWLSHDHVVADASLTVFDCDSDAMDRSASLSVTDDDSDIMHGGIDGTGQQFVAVPIYSGNGGPGGSRAVRLMIGATPDGTELTVPAMLFRIPESIHSRPSDILGLAEELYIKGAESSITVADGWDGISNTHGVWHASAGQVAASRFLWKARTYEDFERRPTSRLLPVTPTEPRTDSQFVPQDYVLEMDSAETRNMRSTLPVTWDAGKGKLYFGITPPKSHEEAGGKSESKPLEKLVVMGMTDESFAKVKQGGDW